MTFFQNNIAPRLVLWALFTTINLTAASSISDDQTYPNFCMQAAKNPTTFASFKRSPFYTPILEHTSFEQGQQYLDSILKKSPKLVSLFRKFKANDRFGDPLMYRYGSFGKFSPTTLRYIKVAADLRRIFGNLKGFKIIEIGGGYGGQCTVLSKMCKWANYTIVDLPGPIALTTQYLKLQGVKNVTLLTADQLPDTASYDLVISNYALTECSIAVQDEYIRKVLGSSKRGYITGNFIGADFKFQVHSKEELIDKLRIFNISCRSQPEAPSTAKDNYLLTWNR